MQAATEQSMHFRAIKQQELANMIAKIATTIYDNPQSEPYQGKAPLMPATIKNNQELLVYFARMGIFGDGARADYYLTASINPSLAASFPDDGVSGLIGLAETRREELKIAQPTAPQSGSLNNIKSENKPYGADPYSYRRKPVYSADYLKSFLKGAYRGIEKSVREAFVKIRKVYQSSHDVLRRKKTYNGRDAQSAKANAISLDSYRAAKNQRQYLPPHSSLDLEERVA